MRKNLRQGWVKFISNFNTGADLISVLFLAVTIPHTAQVLQGYEPREWHWLAWSLAGAIDIGIAYGGLVSADSRVDRPTRRWATLLFVGLSLGSYRLNVQHYLQSGADTWWSYGLGLLLPGGILILAKIKSRIVAVRLEKAVPFEPDASKLQALQVTLATIQTEQSQLKHEINTLHEKANRAIEPSLHRPASEVIPFEGERLEQEEAISKQLTLAWPDKQVNARIQEIGRPNHNASLALSLQASDASPKGEVSKVKLSRQQTEAIRRKVLNGELTLSEAREQGVPEGTIYSWKSRYGTQLLLVQARVKDGTGTEQLEI